MIFNFKKAIPNQALLALMLIMFISLSNNWASAQQLCANVFRDSLYLSLKNLHNSTEDFIERVELKHNETKVETLELEIRKLEKLNEDYLHTAGISFVKMASSIKISDLKDAAGENTIFYAIYALTGSRSGNDTARLIFGVQSNLKFKDSPMGLILDPLYRLNYPGFSGHIRSDSERILVGPHVFTQSLLGIGATIRHEIQHYFEQMKISEGKMSLARIEMHNPTSESKESYSDFLRMDEIETHLRDLRTISNSNLAHNKDTNLTTFDMPHDKREELKRLRPQVAKEKLENLRRFFVNSRNVITQIEANLKSGGSWTASRVDKKSGSINLSFFTASTSYPAVNIDLKGLIKIEDINDRKKLRNAALTILEWSQRRIANVEREVDLIDRRINL